MPKSEWTATALVSHIFYMSWFDNKKTKTLFQTILDNNLAQYGPAFAIDGSYSALPDSSIGSYHSEAPIDGGAFGDWLQVLLSKFTWN